MFDPALQPVDVGLLLLGFPFKDKIRHTTSVGGEALFFSMPSNCF